MQKLNCFIILLHFIISGIHCNVTPVVMWHGMGDTCCFPFSLGSIKKMMETKLDGVYVKSLRIGDSIISDYESGFFIHPNKQIEEVCKQIKADAKLEKGYNALGFSQGGQFLRAVAQRCPNPPMKNLFSFGGQHQGIFGLPNCNSVSRKTCEIFRKLLNHVAYTNWTQNYLVQATYWHDPLEEDKFKMYSTFLADINNEQNLNTDYIKNLQNLERLILIKFTEDTIVQPKESQWFEFYVPGQDKLIQPLNESSLYTDNRLGLKDMMDSNKLIFLESKGNHLQFTDEWFNTHIIPLLTG